MMALFLVPKLHFGTHLSVQFNCKGTGRFNATDHIAHQSLRMHPFLPDLMLACNFVRRPVVGKLIEKPFTALSAQLIEGSLAM